MSIIVLSNHTRIGAWVTRKCRGKLYNIILFMASEHSHLFPGSVFLYSATVKQTVYI